MSDKPRTTLLDSHDIRMCDILRAATWVGGDKQCRQVMNTDCVYFAVNPHDHNTVKVGKTHSVRRRMGALKWSVAKGKYTFQVLAIIITPDHNALEALLHRHFAEHRITGEWFYRAPVAEYLQTWGVTW